MPFLKNRTRFPCPLPQNSKLLSIEWLMEHARQYSASFSSSEASIARQRYTAEHPSAIAALTCMDGRINIPVATNTPPGIILSFRNLDGPFDLGWPYLGQVLTRHVQSLASQRRPTLVPVMYHQQPFRKHSAACSDFHSFEFLWSRRSASALMISTGRGGHPLMRTSTGMWRSTGPVTA